MKTSRSVTDSPGDGEDVISLSQEPREGKLAGSNVLLLGELFDLVNDPEVLGEVLRYRDQTEIIQSDEHKCRNEVEAIRTSMMETDLFGEPGTVFTEITVLEIIRRPELSSQESSSYVAPHRDDQLPKP